MKRIYKEYDPKKNNLEAGSFPATAVHAITTLFLHMRNLRSRLSGLIFIGEIAKARGTGKQHRGSQRIVINIIAKITKNARSHSLIQRWTQGSLNPSWEAGVNVKKVVKQRNSLVYTMIMLVSTSLAFAQGTPKLDIQINNEKVNLSARELLDKTKVRYSPGDTLRYLIKAANIGDGLMTKPEIVDPIPAGVTYVANSASGEKTAITFSINQGTSYQEWPPFYTVRNSRGILVKKEATPDMVTHIKWNIQKNLDPGEAMTLDFLVVVNK